MKTRRLLSVTEPVEVRVAWYAACLSVLLAAAATVPGIQLKALTLAGGMALAVVLAPLYLAYATSVHRRRTHRRRGRAVHHDAAATHPTPAPRRRVVQPGRRRREALRVAVHDHLVVSRRGPSHLGAARGAGGTRRGGLGEYGSMLASVLTVAASIGFVIVGACPVGLVAPCPWRTTTPP